MRLAWLWLAVVVVAYALVGCTFALGPEGRWLSLGIWEGASLEVDVMGNSACLGCFETLPVEPLEPVAPQE